MSAQTEMWRVDTPEGIFEADLETLKQWISEGAVIATDKVSKGTLKWIDAGKAPMLRTAFSNKAANIPYTPPAPAEPVEEAPYPPTSAIIAATAVLPSPAREASSIGGFGEPESQGFEDSTFQHHHAARTSSNRCVNHPSVAAHYICRVCGATFCQSCPRVVNGVHICLECGDLCKLYQDEHTRALRQELQGEGFGFSDFGRALQYPFQHKVALLCGALIYGLLVLGGLKGQIVAWVIMFGCISHVISQVAWGRLNRSFMPDFSAFNLWDDFAVPLGLGTGIVIVTWGPMIVLIIALVFGVANSVRKPSLGPTAETAETTPIKDEDLKTLMDPEADPNKLKDANDRLNQTRPGSQISRVAEDSKREQSDPAAQLKMLLPYLGAGIIFVLLFLLALAWAIFYWPMALAVAGYTQSFGSVVNPMVGLDTIRRMGGTYFKAFGMVILIQIVAGIIGLIVAIITYPFALPFVGNLPATFINGSVTFYFNLVIACLLGLSLFKCADRLGISVD
jgi:hypothetical protein